MLMWNSIMTYTGFLIYFINYLSEVWSRKDKIPNRSYGSTSDYDEICQEFEKCKECKFYMNVTQYLALKSWFFLRRGDNRTQIEFERGSFLSLCG